LIEEKRVPCTFCGEKIIEGATKCRFCKEMLHDGLEVVETVPEAIETVPEVTETSPEVVEVEPGSLPRSSPVRTILVLAYIVILVGGGFYEYKAFDFFDDAQGYARDGSKETALNVYRYVADKYEFSFFAIEANEQLDREVRSSLPIFVAKGCLGVLILLFFLRLIYGRFPLGILFFGALAAMFLIVQLIWNGTLDYEPLDELAKDFMSDPRSSYIVSYVMLVVTAGFSLGRLRKVKGKY